MVSAYLSASAGMLNISRAVNIRFLIFIGSFLFDNLSGKNLVCI